MRDCRHAALRERPRGAIDHVQLDRDDDQWTRISFVAPFPYEKGIVPYGLESDIEISPGVNKYMGVGGFGRLVASLKYGTKEYGPSFWAQARVRLAVGIRGRGWCRATAAPRALVVPPLPRGQRSRGLCCCSPAVTHIMSSRSPQQHMKSKSARTEAGSSTSSLAHCSSSRNHSSAARHVLSSRGLNVSSGWDASSDVQDRSPSPKRDPGLRQDTGGSSSMHANITSESSAARRVTIADQALNATRDALKEKIQQLELSDREHQIAIKAREQADHERKQLRARGLDEMLKQKRSVAKALRLGIMGWLDPTEMETQIRTARLVSLEAHVIDRAEAVLQARRETLLETTNRIRLDADLRGAEASRRARAEVVGDALTTVAGQMSSSSIEIDVRLTLLFATSRAARREGVEQGRISDAQDLLRQWTASALEDAMKASTSLESLRLLESIVKLCKDADLRVHNNVTDRQIGPLLQQAEHILDSTRAMRIKSAMDHLNQVLINGSSSVYQDRNEVSLLEEAIAFVDDALSALGSFECNQDAIADLDQVQTLRATALSRLQARYDEFDQLEEERYRGLDAAWRAQRQQLELNISAARTAVEANEERRRLAEEAMRLVQNFESTENMRRTAAAKQFEQQRGLKEEMAELQQSHERQLQDALDEVKRLKWSIKIQQDGTAATVKKAKEDAKRIKDKSEDEARQAKREAMTHKKALENTRDRLQSENDKQARQFREVDERQQERIKVLEAQLKEEQKQTQLARDYAEQIKSDQTRIVGEWQTAEKEAMALANKNLAMAEKNSEVAKQALDAQKKAEEEMREAQKETRELRDDIEAREQKLKDINASQLDTVKQEKLNAQMFKDEADRLRAIEEKLSEELSQEKAHMEEAREKIEELRAELEKTKNEMRESNDKFTKVLREREEEIKHEQETTAASKEECLKVRAELAEANEGRRKAKVEAKKMRVEHTEGTEARLTAEREAKEATDAANKANAALEEMAEKLKKAEWEVRNISNELTQRHNRVLEELDKEWEKKLAQKERQLEYVEESLERAEAINKKRMDKTAGARNRLDEDLKKAHERVKEAQLETEAKAKEVETLQTKMKNEATRQANAKRAQAEEQEKMAKKAEEEIAKHKEMAEKYKASLAQAIEEKRKVQDELTREVMNSRNAERAGAGRVFSAGSPVEGGTGSSPGGFAASVAMDEGNLERLASMIAANLQTMSPGASQMRGPSIGVEAQPQRHLNETRSEVSTPPPQKRAGSEESSTFGSTAAWPKPAGAVEKAPTKLAAATKPTLGSKAMAAVASREGASAVSSRRGKSERASRESTSRDNVSWAASSSSSEAGTAEAAPSTPPSGAPKSVARPSLSPASSHRSKKAVVGKARPPTLTVVKNDGTTTPPKGSTRSNLGTLREEDEPAQGSTAFQKSNNVSNTGDQDESFLAKMKLW